MGTCRPLIEAHELRWIRRCSMPSIVHNNTTAPHDHNNEHDDPSIGSALCSFGDILGVRAGARISQHIITCLRLSSHHVNFKSI